MRFIPAVSGVQIPPPLFFIVYGPLVKGLRHRLFTAVTRVRIPYGLWYVAVEALDGKSFKKFQKSVDKRKRL